MNEKQCSICLKEFSTKQSLIRHQNKKYKCYLKSETNQKIESDQNNLNNSGIKLTSEQNTIINSDISLNIRIIAGAGCAKTTTILYRIKYLIENNIDPKSIILTTFTKDACLDMKQKLNKIVQNSKIQIGTIDSISKRITDKYTPSNENNTCYVGEYKIRFYKFLCDFNNPKLKEFLNGIKYLFVDEFQDINHDYHNLITKLYQLGVIITVVGDDCQNIYSWNGSHIKYILEFQNNFKNSESFFLTQNFRSTPEILAVANQSILKNENQIYKIIKSNIDTINFKPTISYYYSWDKEYITIRELIKKYICIGIEYHDICILCRNCTDNGPLYFFETNLAKDNIPTCLLEGNKDVRSKIKEDHICLSTIHKSKGLEWKVVFILGCEDKYFPSKKDCVSIDEDRRLFYVAITRAKYYLHLSLSTRTDPCISRFITEIEPKFFNFINTYNLKKRLSNSEKIYEELSVTKLIENLKTENYLELKEAAILPKLEWEQINIYDENKYHNFIVDNDLFADFGIFIDNLITRQIGDIDFESRGKTDNNANKVIAKVVLSPYHYSIYKLYRNNFQLNLKFINNSETTQIINILGSKKNHDHYGQDFIKIIDRNHYSSLIEIVNLLMINSRKFKLPLQDIPVFSENLLPKDFINEMETSYLNYTSNLSWKDIIHDIYRVSRSSNILKGRSRLLYSPISDKQLMNYSGLFNDINNNYIETYCKNQKNICKPIYFYKNIIGEIDCITNRTLVDYKVSYQKQIQIEHILQLLTYSVLSNMNNQVIDKIRIYNPIKGIVSTADISHFKNGDLLIEYLLNVRNNKIEKEKKLLNHGKAISEFFIDTSRYLFKD